MGSVRGNARSTYPLRSRQTPPRAFDASHDSTSARRIFSLLVASRIAWFSSGVPPWFRENSSNLPFIADSDASIPFFDPRPVAFEHSDIVKFLPLLSGCHIGIPLPELFWYALRKGFTLWCRFALKNIAIQNKHECHCQSPYQQEGATDQQSPSADSWQPSHT